MHKEQTNKCLHFDFTDIRTVKTIS